MNHPLHRFAFAVCLLVLTEACLAQAPGLSRVIVGKSDVSIPNREAVIARVEVAPGAMAGWHNHPGEEVSYVLEGEATLYIAGQAPRKVSAGEAFVVPGGLVHNALNSGTVPTKLIGVYVVDKGQPLATPAPAPVQ